MLGIGTVLLVEDRRGVVRPRRAGQRGVRPGRGRSSARASRGWSTGTASGASCRGRCCCPRPACVGTRPAGRHRRSRPAAAARRRRHERGLQPARLVRRAPAGARCSRERPAEVPRAYAWEAVVDEVVFVLGPLVVVLCAVLDPAVGLLAALALGTAGTLSLRRRSAPPSRRRAAGGGRRASALASPGLRTLTVVDALRRRPVRHRRGLDGRLRRGARERCRRRPPARARRRRQRRGRAALRRAALEGRRCTGACSWPSRFLARRARAAAARAERPAHGAGGAAGGLRDQPDAHRRLRPGRRPGAGRRPHGGLQLAQLRPRRRRRRRLRASGAVADGAGARTAFLVALGGALAAGAVALAGWRTLVAR